MIYENILDTIGNTPVVRLNRIAPHHVDMFVKIESFNPMASVKDRLAFAIIDDAERRGLLEARPDRRRGDIGQHRHRARDGLRSEGLSVRRDDGRIVLGRAAQDHARARREGHPDAGGRARHGMVRRAEELAEQHGWFLARQFENPANPEYHRNTTGPEILRDFANRRLDYWVTGWGTGGTMTGAGKVIKAARPEVKIIATEPAGASLLGGAEWQPHKIQGWTPDFVPDVLDREVYDELVPVTDEEARRTRCGSRAKKGSSSDCRPGPRCAALKVAADGRAGSTILAMLPDTGERYLSTYLFEELNEGSDDDWLDTLS